MAIEAPISKFKKNNIKIFIAVLIGLAVWFTYDGYYSQKFIEEHTTEEGPDSVLVFNQKSPPFFVGAAVILVVYFFVIKGRKIIAEENELIINDKVKIGYDSIEKIDKTHFDAKGFFVITYKDQAGDEIDRKLSDRDYDNLSSVLDHIAAKIS